jgi:hypothetical protein
VSSVHQLAKPKIAVVWPLTQTVVSTFKARDGSYLSLCPWSPIQGLVTTNRYTLEMGS